jgi:hypothetical protein
MLWSQAAVNLRCTVAIPLQLQAQFVSMAAPVFRALVVG